VRGCCSGLVIGGIVDHSCLNFLFVPFSTYKETPHIEEKKPREHPFNTLALELLFRKWKRF
jgi:hypothetical protein